MADRTESIERELRKLTEQRTRRRRVLLDSFGDDGDFADAASFAKTWPANLWRLVDDLLSVLRIPSAFCEVTMPRLKIRLPAGDDSIENLMLVSESGSEFDVRISEGLLKCPHSILPEHFSTFDEIVLALRVVASEKPSWPLDVREWVDFSIVCSEVVERLKAGDAIDSLPHAEFRRHIVRCAKQVQALGLFARIHFPEGENVPTQPAETKAYEPTQDDIEACRGAIREHMQEYGGQLPGPTAVAKKLGGTKKRMLKAAKIALAEFYPAE